jgi:hypothetical protein
MSSIVATMKKAKQSSSFANNKITQKQKEQQMKHNGSLNNS